MPSSHRASSHAAGSSTKTGIKRERSPSPSLSDSINMTVESSEDDDDHDDDDRMDIDGDPTKDTETNAGQKANSSSSKSGTKWFAHEIETLMQRAAKWAADGKFIPLHNDAAGWSQLAGDAFKVPCPPKTMSRLVHASYRRDITVPLREKYHIPDHMFAGTTPREPSMKKHKIGPRKPKLEVTPEMIACLRKVGIRTDLLEKQLEKQLSTPGKIVIDKTM